MISLKLKVVKLDKFVYTWVFVALHIGKSDFLYHNNMINMWVVVVGQHVGSCIVYMTGRAFANLEQ